MTLAGTGWDCGLRLASSPNQTLAVQFNMNRPFRKG